MIFAGSYFEVFKNACKKKSVEACIIEKSKVNKSIVDLASRLKIPVFIVTNKLEVEQVVEQFPGRVLVSASFGIIFSTKSIKACDRVINFHPGDFLYCRGRHPLPLAIIKKIPLMSVTVHEIDSQEIDNGKVLMQASIPIDYLASYKSNEKRLLELIEKVSDFVFSFKNIAEIKSIHVPIGAYNKKVSKDLLCSIIECENLGNLDEDCSQPT